MSESQAGQGSIPAPRSRNIQQMLAANRDYVARGGPDALPDAPARGLAIVTCADQRLTDLWGDALGLKRGDALVIRNAGNTLAANDDMLRSLAVGVYLKGVSEVVVLGHTDCGMTKITASAFTDAMRRAGVSREAIPGLDLREWLGAFAREDDNVRETVRRIRGSGVLPQGMPVHGLIIDIATGEVRVVE